MTCTAVHYDTGVESAYKEIGREQRENQLFINGRVGRDAGWREEVFSDYHNYHGLPTIPPLLHFAACLFLIYLCEGSAMRASFVVSLVLSCLVRDFTNSASRQLMHVRPSGNPTPPEKAENFLLGSKHGSAHDCILLIIQRARRGNPLPRKHSGMVFSMGITSFQVRDNS